MIRFQNKDFTLVRGHVLDCAPVLLSKVIGMEVFVFLILSFQNDLHMDSQWEF